MRVCSSLAVLIALGLCGSALPGQSINAPAGSKNSSAKLPQSAPARAVAVDLYGDPLPPGAVARLGTVRFRRSGYFEIGRSGLGFVADGRTIVTGDSAAVQFWESSSGRLLRELRPEHGVEAFAISADGKSFAVGTADEARIRGQIRVYDARTAKLLQTFSRASFRQVYSLALSADGRLLFSLGREGPLRVEIVDSGKEIVRHELANYIVRGMQVARNNEFLALALDAKVYLWKWRTEEPKLLLARRDVTGVCFSPDGSKLAVTSSRLHMLEVATGRTLYERDGFGAAPWLHAPLFTPDGETRLVPLYAKGRARTELLDAATGRSTGVVEGVGAWALSPDSKQIVATAGLGLRVWDLATHKTAAAPYDEAPAVPPSHLLISRQGLVVSAGGTRLYLWDAATSKQRRVHDFQSEVRSIALSGDGNVLAVYCMDNTLRLLAVDGGREIYRLPGHGQVGMPPALAFTPDGKSLLSFGEDFYLRRWDTKTGRAVQEHAIRPDGVKVPDADDARGRKTLRYSLNNSLITADAKTLLLDIADHFHFFDTATGKQTGRLRHDAVGLNRMTVSPDARHILREHGRSGPNTHDLALRAWHADEFMKITMPGVFGGDMAFAADSRSFAAAVPDEIRIFETASGQQRARIAGFRGRVTSLAFSPDGRRLASGHSDSTVLIWDLTSPWKE